MPGRFCTPGGLRFATIAEVSWFRRFATPNAKPKALFLRDFHEVHKRSQESSVAAVCAS